MNDTERALALADRFWEELLERDPTFATAIGDDRYDDRLPDIGEAGRALSETRNRAALEELATIDRDSLDSPRTMDVLGRSRPRRSRGSSSDGPALHGEPLRRTGVLLGDIASIQRTDSPSTWTATTRACADPRVPRWCAEIAREGVATGSCPHGRSSSAPSRRSSASWPRRRRTPPRSRRWPTTRARPHPRAVARRRRAGAPLPRRAARLPAARGREQR